MKYFNYAFLFLIVLSCYSCNRKPSGKESAQSSNTLLQKQATDAVIKGDYTAAIPLYTELIEKNPDVIAYYSALAHEYLRAGNQGQAIQIIKTALEKSPEYHEGLFSLGLIYYSRDDKQKASSYFNDAIMSVRNKSKKEQLSAADKTNFIFYHYWINTAENFNKKLPALAGEINFTELQIPSSREARIINGLSEMNKDRVADAFAKPSSRDVKK